MVLAGAARPDTPVFTMLRFRLRTDKRLPRHDRAGLRERRNRATARESWLEPIASAVASVGVSAEALLGSRRLFRCDKSPAAALLGLASR